MNICLLLDIVYISCSIAQRNSYIVPPFFQGKSQCIFLRRIYKLSLLAVIVYSGFILIQQFADSGKRNCLPLVSEIPVPGRQFFRDLTGRRGAVNMDGSEIDSGSVIFY